LTDLYACKVGAFQLAHPVYLNEKIRKYETSHHGDEYAIATV